MQARLIATRIVSLTVLVVGLVAMGSLPAWGADKPRATSKPSADSTEAPDKPAPAAPATSKDAAKGPRIAHMRIAGEISEAPPQFSLFGEGMNTRKTLRDWLNRLAKARQDDQVDAVALDLENLQVSWAQAQELADAIDRIRKVKPVYAYINSAGVAQYIAASAASVVDMEPSDDLEIVGLAAELTFFRGTLDLIGVEPQMIQVGKFKGASEPMMLKQPSKEFAGEYNSIFDNLYEQLCQQIAEHRKLTAAQVKEAIDQGPFDAALAKKLHLVDRLVPKSEWEKQVVEALGKGPKHTWKANYGQEPRKQLDLSNPFALIAMMMKEPEGDKIKDPTVAVVHLEGMIVSGRSGEGLLGQKIAGARTLNETLKDVLADSKIRAVVLRIDSPGGSALASELINQAVRACAAKKPVIVSVSGMAASGGYYIAVGAPTIYADSTALIGSIGVISGKLATSRLMDKLGITTYEVTRGKNAGLGLSRPWTEAELAVMQRLAQRTYDQFVKRVSESRGAKIKEIDDVAQGRIFTAPKALELGMIDKIGGLREAVDAARKAAKLETSNIISLPRTRTLPDLLFGEDDDDALSPFDNSMQLSIMRKLHGRTQGAAYLLNLAKLLQEQSTLMVLPYCVEVK